MNIKNLKLNLEKILNESEKAIIVPHNRADCDAIASALGISLYAKKLKKPSYILMNDPVPADFSVGKMIDETRKDYNIINLNKYKKITDDNDCFILTDVNKNNLICANEFLKDPEKVLIIDHHDPDDNTVKSNYQYIDTNYSSASEIVTHLLNVSKIKIPANIANFLYSGIYLDTSFFKRNICPQTFIQIQNLIESGADVDLVNRLFSEKLSNILKVKGMMENTQLISYMIALIAANEEEEYTTVEIAKAADEALGLGVDAAFAIGRIEDGEISISGRSRSDINIGCIMGQLGGGGNATSGATKINDSTVTEVEEQLKKVLRPSYYKKEEKKK